MLNELGYDIPVKPLDSHKVILFWNRVYLVSTVSLSLSLSIFSELKHKNNQESSTGKASWQGNELYVELFFV